MKQLLRLLAYPVMGLAGLGVIASFVLFALSLGSTSNLDKTAFHFLFPGTFVVWLPTILFANVFVANSKQGDFWRAALRGCPPWMKVILWFIIIAVVFVTFFLPFIRGSKPGASPSSFLIFPSIFYAISFCISYSFLSVEKSDAQRRCLNDHPISSGARFCEACGAPAAPEGMQQPRMT